jgi:hypothetical protein
VAEWLKATVLKTVDGKPFQSSNLCSSAIHSDPVLSEHGVFCFCVLRNWGAFAGNAIGY